MTLHSFPALDPAPCVLLSAHGKTLYASASAQAVELPDAEDDGAPRRAYSYQARGGGAGGAEWPLIAGDAVLTLKEGSRTGPLICRAGFHVRAASPSRLAIAPRRRASPSSPRRRALPAACGRPPHPSPLTLL